MKVQNILHENLKTERNIRKVRKGKTIGIEEIVAEQIRVETSETRVKIEKKMKKRKERKSEKRETVQRVKRKI